MTKRCHKPYRPKYVSTNIDRAANEVIRRVRNRINNTSVMREMRKEAA